MTERRVSRKGKLRRSLEILLLMSGVACVGVWGRSQIRMAIFESRANRILERRMAAFPPRRAVPGTPPATTPAAPKAGALLGRLVIPRLGLRAVVLEGAGKDTLDVALGHIPGTALPGSPGNVGVAGHRDTLFRALRRIQKNDLIRFQTQQGSYSYRVESTGIVKPGDVAVLQPGGQPELTLVTCYPFYYVGPAPDRFVVKARQVNPPPTEAASVQSARTHNRAREATPAS